MMTMMKMGHGDEICFCDANFPADSVGDGVRVIRADGHRITDLIGAVLRFMPLDNYVELPAVLMDAPEGAAPKVWDAYDEVIKKHDFAKAFTSFEKMERFAFYVRARKSYALVATSESEPYANIILKKGVI
jgi:L-fucose mutarotase